MFYGCGRHGLIVLCFLSPKDSIVFLFLFFHLLQMIEVYITVKWGRYIAVNWGQFSLNIEYKEGKIITMLRFIGH